MRLLALIGLSIVMASGCALAQNTLAQDLAWERWEKCKDAGNTVTLKEIRPDGQIWVTYSASHGYSAWVACDSQARADQATRPASATTARASGPQPLPSSITAPEWMSGAEWAYRWEGAQGRGTYVWSIDDIEAVDGVPHYVIASGSRRIFFRKSDMALTKETVENALVLRYTPSRLRYDWPLTVGKTWEQSLREERPGARQTTQRIDVVTVEAEESVTVPAGTFKTLRLVYRNKGTGAVRYEEWYAPEVRAPVRLRERLASGERVRELIGYRFR